MLRDCTDQRQADRCLDRRNVSGIQRSGGRKRGDCPRDLWAIIRLEFSTEGSGKWTTTSLLMIKQRPLPLPDPWCRLNDMFLATRLGSGLSFGGSWPRDVRITACG